MSPTPPEPIWSPEDHLDRVYRRGRRLRQRRRVGMAAVALVAIVVVGAVAGDLTRSDSGHRIATRPGANATRPTTSPAPAPSDTLTPSTTNATDTTSAANTTNTTNSTGPAATGGPAATSAPPTPARTGPKAQTTIATTPTTVASTVNNTPCGPGQLTFATQTDRTSYPLGTSVMISVMVRNLSSHPCAGPGLCGIGPSTGLERCDRKHRLAPERHRHRLRVSAARTSAAGTG